ncbi:MAG: menaquinone biosynthesis protein [Lentimicrobiaceae bacterium]|nr:menaquinone biosynthesis protein [Lentimicrobiaceae bacterium]
MDDIKIVSVSYTNTLPFIYGIENSGFIKNYALQLLPPSGCAKALKNNEADIGLVPVGALSDFEKYFIHTDYCIGAVNYVKTVLLVSNTPIDKIETIYLDSHSRTSVKLCRVLAKNHWKINPKWKDFVYDKDNFALQPNEAAVLIGDKTFEVFDKYKYVLDLANQWYNFTSLPFVFALWISAKEIKKEIIDKLNSALCYGINSIDDCIDNAKNLIITRERAKQYFENDISYNFDNDKKKGLKLFLKFAEEL